MSRRKIEWDHCRVFIALVSKGMPTKSVNRKGPFYVKLYAHEPNAALLYDLNCPSAPVHIHERHIDPDVWMRIKPHLRKTSKDRDPRGFEYYSVEDWNGLATSLGLG